jgi:myo-inositol-1(or 4)-monophosphatase
VFNRRVEALDGWARVRWETPILTALLIHPAIVSLGDYAVGPGAAVQNHQLLTLTGELIPRIERIRMIGAATLDLAFVAEEAVDACVMMSNKPGKTAAGTLLAREAGAHVTAAQGNPHTQQSAGAIS